MFKDHFSRQSDAYANHRPGYPGELFAWLAKQAPERDIVWDCATGSGQAAIGLAAHFASVIASDASAAQIRKASPCFNVNYLVAGAERSPFKAESLDMVTVAQALHWFDRTAFFTEVDRVLKPTGVLAVWTYNLLLIDPSVDGVIQRLYREVLEPYWPPERALVAENYRSIQLPFSPLNSPRFTMHTRWNLEQLAGYLSSWSAVSRHDQATGEDAMSLVWPDLLDAWGAPKEEKIVKWPLTLLAAMKA